MYNIFYFNIIKVEKDNKTVERVELYNNDYKKPKNYKLDNGILKGLLDNKNNLFVGWDNKEQFNSLKCKAPYLDYCKAYSKIVLNNIDDCRSLTELKQTYNINNVSDVKAMQFIDNEEKIIDKIMELMKTTGIRNPNKVFYPTSCLESYIAKNEIPIKSNNDNTNKGYNLGGLNIIGENKRYENLKHFDVNSFYPNMLISLQASSNLDYLNLKCSTVKELTEDWEPVSKTKGTAFYILNDGLKQAKKLSNGEYKVIELDSNFDLTESNKDIAKLTSELLQLKENNTGNLRTAYKTLVNGLYGALDSEKYFKYNHVNLMAVTTFLCRYVLYNCYKEFNGVYAKTDSIWTTNKNITEEDLNNYSNDLLNSIGIPNSCIKWELESEPNKLFIKDSNNYIEVIGDEYNFKGSYEAPIQEIALKKAIENKRVDINRLFDDYKDKIPLFCKHPKYSTSQENQDRFNKVLTEIKGYTIEPNKKCYQYFSIHGWVNGLEIDQFNLEVDEDYGLNLITKILYDYDFITYIHKFNITEKYKAPKFVPMYLSEGDRLIQNNSKLNHVFKVKDNNYSIKDRLQKLVLPYSSEYQYKGIVLGTNYYAIDIDRKDFQERTETIKNEILKLFKKDEFVLQETKSNGYHIIFKTDQDLTGFEPASTKEGYEGLELKVNAVLPFHTYKYHVKEHSSRYNVFDGLNRIVNFKEIDKLKRFYGYDETKKTKEIIPVNDNVKDFQELDKLTSQLIELSNLVLDNHHDLSLAIGGSLRGLLNTEDIEQLSKDLEKGTTSKKVTARTIKDGYKGAKPTNSLGLLVKFIEKQPNENELMKVVKMIDGTLKNNKMNNVMDMNNNQESSNSSIIKNIAKTISDNVLNFAILGEVSHNLKYNKVWADKIINEINNFYHEREQEIINKYFEVRNVSTVDNLYNTIKLDEFGMAEANNKIREERSRVRREGKEDDYADQLKMAKNVLGQLEAKTKVMPLTKDYIYSCFAKSLLTLGYDKRSLTGDIYQFTEETGWKHIPLDDFKANLNSIYNNDIKDEDITKLLQYLNTLPKPQYNVVQFLNGQYNMETHEFKETDKDTFTLLNIPYEYNAEAKPTLICEFLNKSLPNYELKQIFEVIGYLFTSGNERQVMVWLTSTGGGGKSVLANILRAIFHNQTCNIDLADFGRFDLGAFTHSHINICSEIDNKATAKAKHYKNLTGNDPLKVEIKFKDPIVLDKEEVPKNIQVCNNMPNFDTLDNPLLQRFLIIEFPKRFRNTDEQIKGLDDKIIESKEDMEWLIYQSLQAHKTMCKENKDFAIRLSEEETRKRVVANNNPLIPAIDALVDFNDEFGIMGTSCYIIADEFKEILDLWIKENGLNVIHDKTGTINNKAIINSIKTNFDIWDETWQVKEDDIKELHYTTNRKTVNGKQQRVFPFLEKTEEYKELEAKWQAQKLSGKQNKKHIENPIKENKPHELAYIESEDNPNQPQQKELI